MRIERLDAAASLDGRRVDELTSLINRVYAVAECGLWREGTTRTTAPEVAMLIAAGEIAVARTPDGEVVGAVQLHQVSDDTSELGMLVSAPEHRGTGVGRALPDFAEAESGDRGLRAIQFELLVPRGWRHPSKEFLRSWYGRRGYRKARTGSLDEGHPHLTPLLATPCDLEIHERLLTR